MYCLDLCKIKIWYNDNNNNNMSILCVHFKKRFSEHSMINRNLYLAIYIIQMATFCGQNVKVNSNSNISSWGHCRSLRHALISHLLPNWVNFGPWGGINLCQLLGSTHCSDVMLSPSIIPETKIIIAWHKYQA